MIDSRTSSSITQAVLLPVVLVIFGLTGTACARDDDTNKAKTVIKKVDVVAKAETKEAVSTPPKSASGTQSPKPEQDTATPAQAPWNLANELGQRIVDAAKRPNQNQKRFVAEVEGLLSELINFDVFAGNVMGKYARQDYIDTLSQKERKVLAKQIKRFSKVFRAQLIDVYSTTFWNVAKKVTLDTLPATPSSKPTQQIIRQKILGVSDKPVLIYYQMVMIGDTWQIKNLAVQGVDLGKIYRQQFYNLMTEHEENIDQVIKVWAISS